MPHIDPQRQFDITHSADPPDNMGELAFVLATAINEYVAGTPEDIRFQRIGEVLGAIESAKAEFLTNVHDPYERHKARVNGNAYEAAAFEVERVARQHD